MPQQIPDEARLFEAALDCPSAELRAAFLDQACAGQPELRQRLERLLAAHDHAGSFLEPPLPGGTARVKFPLEEKPGDTIGNYKLREQIGEGGFGVVFVADQETPVRRRVAIKVVKLGMDTKQVIARFEAERQVLALMDHPNIAKVLDAGSTRNGRPYFVMELVRGVKITDYCDQNNLATEERLKLFIQVCQAVQHAHQKGIIHRDIKPSNILVTLHDGVPVPKVIDFGIAKATNNQQLTDKTIYTAFEQFMGTPAYMSPEQAEMSGLDIDTRSDIYSLGVLLYELLTGRTPFDPNTLFQAGIDQMRRIIREEEPARPSLCLKTLSHADLSTAAHRRQTEPPRLINKIRGDLDWIVMKSLEKDRTRRYESASSLALEIRKHLEQEPVEARPPSQFYRLQKMFLRNKLAFGATSGILLALLLGLSAAIWFLHREKTAVERALTAEKALNRAQQEAVAQNLLNQYRYVDTDEFYNPVRFAEVEKAERQALGIQTNLYGETNEDVLTTISQLIFMLSFIHTDTQTNAELNRLVRKALQIEQALYGVQSTNVAEEMLNNLTYINPREEQEKMFENAIRIEREAFGPHSQRVVNYLYQYAQLNIFSQAEQDKIISELLENWRLHPETRFFAYWDINNIGRDLAKRGRVSAAESFYRNVLDLGIDLKTRENLANLLLDERKFQEAEPVLRSAIRNEPFSYTLLTKLIFTLKAEGKTNEADLMFNQSREVFKAQFNSSRVYKKLPSELLSMIGFIFPLGKEGEREAINIVTEPLSWNVDEDDKSDLLFERGQLRARLNQMTEASQDFSEAVKLITQPILPSDTLKWDYLAFSLVASGKLAEYQSLLRAYAPLLTGAKDLQLDCEDVSVFLLFPNSKTNLDIAGVLVVKLDEEEKTLKEREGIYAEGYMSIQFYNFIKALFDYRQGRYASAIEFAQQALDDTKHANAYQVMAMAQFKLGNFAAAQESLKKAAELAKTIPDWGWPERIMTRILFDEAEGLMGHSKPAATPTK